MMKILKNIAQFLYSLYCAIVGFVFSAISPIPKYSTTVDDTLTLKDIPKDNPIVVPAFYTMVVQPNSVFELVDIKDNKAKLVQLSTGKIITINQELFTLNFKEYRDDTADQYLDKIIKDSKSTTK